VFHSHDISESEVFLGSIPTATNEIETLGEDSTSEVHESDDTDGDDVGSSAIKTLFHTSSNLILHPFLILK
jgi:hypothetical protein